MERKIKYFPALFLLFFMAGSVFANDVANLNNIFFGIGGEANANTSEGAAIGGNVSFGIEFLKQFNAGLKVIFSHDTESIFTIEPLAFFRYYLPLGIPGFFAQLEMGASVFIEDDKGYPAFSVGAAAGWRFQITNIFYIEPYARAGYPFVWGAGLTAGMILPFKAGKGGQ